MAQEGKNFVELTAIMRRLLAPDGCPWDREQSLETLKPFLLEEAHEVIEAIDDGDAREHCDELGDLLFQIVFQAELRAAEGKFGIDDVVNAIATKMVRRHPHVFGEAKVKDADEVLANWGKLKAAEHAEQGKKRATLDGVPSNLPSLLKAQRIGEKAAKVGFDWPDLAGVRKKVDEELGELDQAIATGDPERIGEELGDLLFVLTRLASWTKVDAEGVLSSTIARFRRRFEDMESRAGRPLDGMSLEEMDVLWREAKLRTLPKK
jgi:tetrapyrrole methylase family protein/MazG family protein/ATP diphosphatase